MDFKDLIAFAHDFGLPGLSIVALAWTVTRVTPHITKAWVDDRKDRRKYEVQDRGLKRKAAERGIELPKGRGKGKG